VNSNSMSLKSAPTCIMVLNNWQKAWSRESVPKRGVQQSLRLPKALRSPRGPQVKARQMGARSCYPPRRSDQLTVHSMGDGFQPIVRAKLLVGVV
jgi:hypothetical protein